MSGQGTGMSASTSAGGTDYCDTNGDSLSCASDETNDPNSLSGHAQACISSATIPMTSGSTSTSISPLVTTKVEIVPHTEAQLICSNEDEDNTTEAKNEDTLLNTNSKTNEVEK